MKHDILLHPLDFAKGKIIIDTKYNLRNLPHIANKNGVSQKYVSDGELWVEARVQRLYLLYPNPLEKVCED